MITKDDMIPMLITACPSFLSVFEVLDDEDKSIQYPIIGGLFANHLLALYRSKQTQEFAAVAKVIEQFHIDGDEYVREAATIGILEGIQNIWSHSEINPEIFKEYLLPESMKWWEQLNLFWKGRINYVGESIK